MSIKEMGRLGFIGPGTFSYHLLTEKLKPGWSVWAPDDTDVFSQKFDIVLYDGDGYNIRQYQQKYRAEKMQPLKNILILEGEKEDWAVCDLAIIWDGTKPFRVNIPSENLKIFGAPINHPNYCGYIGENEYGIVLASCNKFLYIGNKHEHLNWTKKSDWGQGESYKERLLQETTLGWFNGKIDIRGYCEDFMRRHQIA